MSETNKYKVTWNEFERLCDILGEEIKNNKNYDYIYPIPKNGMFVAERLSRILEIPVIHEGKYFYEKDILIVDDLIDSGTTLFSFLDDKAVLFVKNNNEDKVNYFVEKTDKWVVFPWEKEDDIEDTIIRQLEYIGEDPTREGLIETPKRVKNSWKELYAGYQMNIDEVFKTFEKGTCDEMVILKDCEFYSTCEHHMLPFFGKINIGYIPGEKIIGISKLARLVEVFSRRLQIQEVMVAQIADILMEKLRAQGVIVTCEAQHFCMTSRGIKKQSSKMITSAVRGLFSTNDQARNEFLNLIK